MRIKGRWFLTVVAVLVFSVASGTVSAIEHPIEFYGEQNTSLLYQLALLQYEFAACAEFLIAGSMCLNDICLLQEKYRELVQNQLRWDARTTVEEMPRLSSK